MTEHPARHIDVFFTPIIFSGNAETILRFSLTSVGELRGPRLHLCLIKQQRFCWYEIQVNADVIKISLLYLLNTYIFKVYHEIEKNYTTSVVAGTSLLSTTSGNKSQAVLLCFSFRFIWNFSHVAPQPRGKTVPTTTTVGKQANVLSCPSRREGLMSLCFPCLCLKMSHHGCNETPH